MQAVLISSDLGCGSRVAGAAARSGVSLVTVMNPLALPAQLGQAKLAILDLSSVGPNLDKVMEGLRQAAPQARIVAFGPHVHESLLQAASAAGCHQVLAKGQFFAQMDQLFLLDGPESSPAHAEPKP